MNKLNGVSTRETYMRSHSHTVRAAAARRGRSREVLVLAAVSSLILLSLVRMTWVAPTVHKPVVTQQAAGVKATASAASPGDPPACHVLRGTELPGDVVRWGDTHVAESAAACCAACRGAGRCNTWVWCGAEAECGARFRQCWLKTRPEPWEDVDLVVSVPTEEQINPAAAATTTKITSAALASSCSRASLPPFLHSQKQRSTP